MFLGDVHFMGLAILLQELTLTSGYQSNKVPGSGIYVFQKDMLRSVTIRYILYNLPLRMIWFHL